MSFSAFDHRCMNEALQLAWLGRNGTHPNPRVGCVIAREDSVIGRGYHRRAGGRHAEVHALAEAGSRASGATAYVTLEPCAHHGRTPPCADALIGAGIARVVAATADPHPEVDGKGLKRLEAAGVLVETGLMAAAAEDLNAGFFSRMRRGRPWVRIKTAQSLDGRIALRDGQSAWITGQAARKDVQQWRAQSDAILTGIGTVLADDPGLDVRGIAVEKPPLRVILDSAWRTPPEAKTLSLPGQVLIVGAAGTTPPPALVATGAECIAVDADRRGLQLEAVLTLLGERSVNEVQVEAGGVLCGALLSRGLVDEVLWYTAPVLLGSDGLPGFAVSGPARMEQRLSFDVRERVMVGQDLRLRLQPQYPST